MKYLFSVNAVKWFDRINGNTYHSINITRLEDGAQIAHEWTYGYGEAYRQTTLETLSKAGWLPKNYTKENLYLYERENQYPILYNVSEGLKRDMIANGKI